MRKAVFSALAALGLITLSALPASAEIAQFGMNGRGLARSDGTALLSGEIKCSSSESYRVWVKLRRNGFSLRGVSERKSCHGAPQPWSAVASDDFHNAHPGIWRLCAAPGDTQPDREPECRRVRLVKG